MLLRLKLPIQTLLSMAPTLPVFGRVTQFQENEHTPAIEEFKRHLSQLSAQPVLENNKSIIFAIFLKNFVKNPAIGINKIHSVIFFMVSRQDKIILKHE